MWDPSTSIASQNDYAVAAVLSVMCPAIRWILHHHIFEPLARCWILPTQHKALGITPDKYAVKIERACESLWKFMVYSGFLATGLYATYQESWAWNTAELWGSWPHQEIKPVMKWLYCGELAFYVSSIAMLLLWEVRRKDFQVMLLHHITTTILISATYYYNYLRVGILVMMLHDTNDVLMEAAKTAKYCSMELLSTTLFGLFVVSWAITRLTLFPLKIIHSTLIESFTIVGYLPPGYKLLNAMLCVLLMLHCYWFYLILNIVRVKLLTGDTRDIREEDEDDDED